ncbi:MAG: hypothetical protein LBP21_04955 [Synergistaceae bacterium]|nr:hypothetical protein [Synergistaceae bacterium]
MPRIPFSGEGSYGEKKFLAFLKKFLTPSLIFAFATPAWADVIIPPGVIVLELSVVFAVLVLPAFVMTVLFYFYCRCRKREDLFSIKIFWRFFLITCLFILFCFILSL